MAAVRLSLQRDPGARWADGEAAAEEEEEEEGDGGKRTAAVWRRYRPFLPTTAQMTTLLCFDPHGQDTAALADDVLASSHTHTPPAPWSEWFVSW